MFISILIVGAGLRFWRLGEWPAGLYQDEAYYGLDALSVLGGARPVYFEANNGREPLFIYAAALAVGALGQNAFALRLTSAVFGTLTIPVTYLLGARLFGRRVGLMAAAVVAFTFWPVALSRIAFRAGSLPLFLGLAAVVGARAFDRHARPWEPVLAGALYGISFYTYLAARFTPVVLSAFALYAWLALGRRPGRRPLMGFVLGAVLALMPLAAYAGTHPDLLLGRSEQVSIFNPAVNGGDLWRTLADHGLRAALAFNVRGDALGRHNLPGRPVFDPALGLAFLAGLIVCLWRARRSPPEAFALAWTGGMLLPTILAEDTPHFLRAVGAWPALALIPALGLDWAIRRIEIATAESTPRNDRTRGLRGVPRTLSLRAAAFFRRVAISDAAHHPDPAGDCFLSLRSGPHRSLLAMTGPAIAGAVLLIGLAITARDYFLRYAPDPRTGYAFQAAATELAARAARASAEGDAVYLGRRFAERFPSVRFLLGNPPRVNLFDENAGLPRLDAPRLMALVWPHESLRPVMHAIPVGSQVEAAFGPLYLDDGGAEPYALFAEIRVRPASPPSAPMAAFEGGIHVVAASVRAEGAGYVVRSVWQAEVAPAADYHLFLQARRGEEWIAGADGPPAAGLYPTSWWRPGDQVVDERFISLPNSAEAGSVVFWVGLYNPASGLRLPVRGADRDWVMLRP